ncbi:hypothetical protein [Gemmata sp.]|uniref:hypothetical protein n=1 Tax=Gemmata sp. TaxID=1914242 RepID=UPI003F72C108
MHNCRTAAVILALSAAAVAAHSRWGASLVDEASEARSTRVEFREEVELQDHLAVVNRELLHRIAIKNELIAELIAGRTTLAEVTQKFLVMNQSRSECMTSIRATYPGGTDEEKTAQNVLGYLRDELGRQTPARRAEVLRRLKAEFETAYPSGFGADFPGDPAPAGAGPGTHRFIFGLMYQSAAHDAQQ